MSTCQSSYYLAGNASKLPLYWSPLDNDRMSWISGIVLISYHFILLNKELIKCVTKYSLILYLVRLFIQIISQIRKRSSIFILIIGLGKCSQISPFLVVEFFSWIITLLQNYIVGLNTNKTYFQVLCISSKLVPSNEFTLKNG